jgi:hypothetical protein
LTHERWTAASGSHTAILSEGDTDIELLLPPAFAALWATLSFRLAAKRGRRPVLWAALGAFFGVLALGTLALLPNRAAQAPDIVTA